MPTRLQITCIYRTTRTYMHERIMRVGGVGWSCSLEEAIRLIEMGTHSFFVVMGPYKADVYVSISQWGNKYLKTRADTVATNNLLSLPECER